MIDMTRLQNMQPAFTPQSVAPAVGGGTSPEAQTSSIGIPPNTPPLTPVVPTPPGYVNPVLPVTPQPQPAPAADNWQNFNWMKDYYGGKWYDFGAKEGQPGWFRAPRINPADAQAVWNQQYGWQDWNTIANLGGNYGSLTPQFGDVYDIYGGYNTSAPLPGGAPADTPGWPGYPDDGTDGGGDGDIQMGGPQYPPWVQPPGGGTPSYGESLGVQQPATWDTAQDVLTQFAEGMPTDVPAEWETLLSQLSDVWGQEGMPVSSMPAYTAAKEAAQYDTKAAIDQAMEGYGLMGLRQSTPAIAQAQRLSSEMAAKLGAQFAQSEMGALEAAKARQMNILPQMFGLGGGIASLEESTKDRALDATSQLGQLGQMQWQMPAALSQQAFNMGSNMYGQSQQGVGNMMNEWLRTQMYNNPYLQQALSLGGQQGQYVPQQYSQGGLLGLGIC